MKKIGTTALVVVTAVALSTFSLGCEKKKEPAPTGGTTAPAGGSTEKPAGGH